MSTALKLRWTGQGINNGRQRLGLGAQTMRHFSYNASRSALSLSRTARNQNCPRINLSQQSRSLSLFGWGSSKAPEEFAKAHPQAQAASAPADSAVQAPTTSQGSLEPLRTVKASHATSENPGQINAEPDALQTLENSVLSSQANPSQTAVTPESPDLASIPEGIGYLKDVCGLDFGWGPTSLAQFFLEHLHITGGLSWTISIAVLAVLLRGACLPWAITASDQAAKMKELQPVIKPLSEKMKQALAENQRDLAVQTQLQIRELRSESGLSFMKMFRPMLLQVPLGYGAWHTLTTAAALPVPSMESEQFLWISNLCVADPTYLLPVLTATMTYFNVRVSQRGQPNMQFAQVLRVVMPVVSGLFLCFQSTAVGIYFLANGIFSQIQISGLQNAAVRRWLKLAPMPLNPSSAPESNTSTRFSSMNMSVTETRPSAIATREPAPSTNRSWIDKGVDSVKGMGRNAWKNSFGAASEKVEERKIKERRERQKEQQAKYEAQRKQDLEMQRSYRNAAMGGKKDKSR